MKNIPYELSGYFNNTVNNSETYKNQNRPTVPQCINTDYCGDTPANRNDGILTMAFVDMQPIESVYPLEKAFSSGTLFQNLDKPFYGGKKQ